MMQELELRKDYLGGEVIQTVYFGGGTPSLIEPRQIAEFLKKMDQLYKVDKAAEITLEANPEHITEEYLDGIAQAGINRISAGIQSFDDDSLRYLGRTHNGHKAEECIHLMVNSRIREYSVDFIFGIPGQTDEGLVSDLEKAVACGIQHISAYSLTIEEGSTLYSRISKQQTPAPSEDQAAAQFGLVMDTLERLGFVQYEISNYCLPGHPSRHNSSYWTGSNYLGIGPSAHSFNGKSRQWNVSRIDVYQDSIAAAKSPAEIEVLSPLQMVNEYIMTSLRTSDGMALSRLYAMPARVQEQAFEVRLDRLEKQGSILRSGDRIRLSRKGKFLADVIASELFFCE